MANIDTFKQTMHSGYTFKGDYITLGGAVYEGQPLDKVYVNAERSEERRVGKECRSRWSPYH